MSITAAMVKELREKTNAGMMDCKKALTENNGDMEKSQDWLRKKGLAVAAKRADRDVSEGRIATYVHGNGKLGVMVEVNTETDFTANTDQIGEFAHDVAMHVAAMNPLAVEPEGIPQEALAKEEEIFKAQAAESGKPAEIIEKMIVGKMRKFVEENCLLKQKFVKNPDVTIEDMLNELRAATGENVQVRRFARFVLGEK